MSETQRSQYADLLEGLGFTKRNRSTTNVTYFLPEGDAPKPEVPRYSPPITRPCFTTASGTLTFTMVSDELGETWVCRGKEIDMREHGFSHLDEFSTLQ